MRDNNKKRKEQLILGTGFQNKLHLTYADVVPAVLNFYSDAATTEFVLLNTVRLNLQPHIKKRTNQKYASDYST